MAFYDVRLDDGLYIYDTVGGSQWNTDVVVSTSGFERRNINWANSRGRWEWGERRVEQADLDVLLDFFAIVRGRANGFRARVRGEDLITVSNGRLGLSAAGSGGPDYNLYRRRTLGGEITDKRIHKPSQATIYRGGNAVIQGAGAGQVSIDFNAGTVIFIADASQAITGHTPGAAHIFTTATNLPTLAIGDKVFLTGITGTAATALNNLAHTISNKTGSGPYTWTIVANTATLTASGGTAKAYPQADEALTWSGVYDFPVRFDVDQIRYRYETEEPNSGTRCFWLYSLPIVEIRL